MPLMKNRLSWSCEVVFPLWILELLLLMQQISPTKLHSNRIWVSEGHFSLSGSETSLFAHNGMHCSHNNE